MGTKLHKTITVLFGALLFPTACSDGTTRIPVGGEEEGVDYDMQWAHYVLSGSVLALNDGYSITGIDVALDTAGAKHTTSGVDGTWTIDANADGSCRPKCRVTAVDIDGAANGSFATKTVSVTLQQTQEGNGTLDVGTWEAHGIIIELAGAGGSATGGSGGSATGGSGGNATGGAGGAGGN